MAVLAPIIRWIRGDFRSGTGLLQEPRIFMVQASDVSMQGIQASRHSGIQTFRHLHTGRRNIPPSPPSEGAKGGSRHDMRDVLAPYHEAPTTALRRR
jgi:hypothetical protein